MLEMRVDFRSVDEWTSWSSQNAVKFASWRRQVIDSVQMQGLVEPVSNAHHTPNSVQISEGDLRETISAGEMNSRKRAALLVLLLTQSKLASARRHKPRILGTEALTRVARILRGHFSYYLGTEFLPTPEEQERHFPIAHMDLASIGFADGAFDLFHSGDVLEHVPDLHQSMAEIARILAPGGVAVSTFPFSPDQPATRVKARLVDGVVEHIETPEIHGNPARPQEGSLVFSLPGWDVLELCREVGFDDAKMTLVVSSTYGITSNGPPGVFVLSASKAPDGAAGKMPMVSKATEMSYQGQEVERLIGLLALPRSGTTLLSSVLGVHSNIRAVYEPWNANKKQDLPKVLTVQDFFQNFPTNMEGKKILFVKETATRNEYIDRMVSFLRTANLPFERTLIILFRNPLHVFLSEFEARRSWWGDDDLTLSQDVFDRWADRTISGFKRLLAAAGEFNAILVSYEHLVTRQRVTIGALMNLLSVPFESRQLEYEAHVRKSEIRGDVNIATSPAAIHAQSIQKRESEVNMLALLMGQSKHAETIEAISAAIAKLADYPALRNGSREAQEIFSTLRHDIAQGVPNEIKAEPPATPTDLDQHESDKV